MTVQDAVDDIVHEMGTCMCACNNVMSCNLKLRCAGYLHAGYHRIRELAQELEAGGAKGVSEEVDPWGAIPIGGLDHPYRIFIDPTTATPHTQVSIVRNDNT